MKKYISIFIFLLICAAIEAHAASPALFQCAGAGEAATCDSCTGSLILSWHAEDANVGTGTPCGCNYDADKDFTFAGSSGVSNSYKGDGTYSYLRSDNTQNATITISNASLSQGYVSFWLRSAHISTAEVVIFEMNYDATNYFRVYRDSSDHLIATYMYGGASRAAATSALTDDTDYNCSAYYNVGGNPTVYVTCDGGITAGSQVNSVSNMAGAPTSFIVGGGAHTTADAYIDKVKVYNVYNP